MFKFFLVPVLAFSVLAPFTFVSNFFHKPATMEDRVSDSIYRITGKETVDTWEGPKVVNYSCTGFQIAPDRIMTAAHCVGEEMRADGLQVKAVVSNKYYDLAVLQGVRAPMNVRPALEFREKPVDRFEDLVAIGYGFGWNKLSVLKERVYIQNYHVDDDAAVGMIVQGGYIGGMSGGPVVDQAGHVVGVVQRGNQQIGYSVGTTIIKAFLLDADDEGLPSEFKKSGSISVAPLPFIIEQ